MELVVAVKVMMIVYMRVAVRRRKMVVRIYLYQKQQW
jgi:hypothetical protein